MLLLSLEEVCGSELDEPGLAQTLVGHPVHEAEGPEAEHLLQWVSIELLLAQSQLDLLFLLQKGNLAGVRNCQTDSCIVLCSDGLFNLLITFRVEDDADCPGALSVHTTAAVVLDLTVELGVEKCAGALSLGQGAQVFVHHDHHLLFTVIVVKSLEVDEPVAHLGIIAAAARLQLDLHIVHHHDFLA